MDPDRVIQHAIQNDIRVIHITQIKLFSSHAPSFCLPALLV